MRCQGGEEESSLCTCHEHELSYFSLILQFDQQTATQSTYLCDFPGCLAQAVFRLFLWTLRRPIKQT